MGSGAGESIRNIVQLLAIVFLILMMGLILHKGFADVSQLAARHSGVEFWIALARHFIANMAG